MQSIVRVLVGIALVGFAVYASFFQYPIESVVVTLLFTGLFIMNPRCFGRNMVIAKLKRASMMMMMMESAS